MTTRPPVQSLNNQHFRGLPTEADDPSQRRTSRDWDEIMGDLVRGLEQICGPRTGRDPAARRSTQLDNPTLSPATSNNSPPNFTEVVRRSERGLHNDSGRHGYKDNGCHGKIDHRRHSDEVSFRQGRGREIFVRHIETHEELNSRLIDICRQRSLTVVERPRISGGLMWEAARQATSVALAAKSRRSAEEEKDGQRKGRKCQRRVRFQMGDDDDEIGLQVDGDQRDFRLSSKNGGKESCFHAQKDESKCRLKTFEDQSDIRLHVEEDQRVSRQHSDEDQRERNIHLPVEKDQRDTHLSAEKDRKDIHLCAEKYQREFRLNVEEDQRVSRYQMEDDQPGLHPIQIEVGSRNIEDLVVAVRDSRHLTVETISDFGDNILYDSLLSDELTSRPLLCHLTGNGRLHIRCQSPSPSSKNFDGTGSTFIPIIRRNEASLELTVVLHIPDNFRFDDVIVRTVDSQLVVIGRKRSQSLQPKDGDTGPCPQTSHSAVRQSFRVLVQLPREVNCRSVNASLTGDHQLIVKGDIDPMPRRNSL